MERVSLTIDGVQVSVPAGTSVLQAAREANVHIPTLCFLSGVSAPGACRMCVVDTGARALQAACVLPATEGMVVKTNTPVVREARRMNLELILSNHDRECLTCVRSRNCELQQLSEELGVGEIRFDGVSIDYPMDFSSPSIVRDPNKCILCRRCVTTCHNVQKVGVIGATGRGFKTIIEPDNKRSIGEVACINCGQCITACPVGALKEADNTEDVWAAIANPDKVVLVQTAPAVRVALGEEFGMPIGTLVTGKMAAALRRMGFDKVFDTDFAADLTIMEEATELLGRINNGGKLPMITSCSPGWIKFCEHNYPDFLDNLSTCKSPHEMMGAVLKSYYAQLNNVDPAKIVTVSVMPCTAKKYEADRPEMFDDVDYVITTRELARMIKQAGIDFKNLEDEGFDSIFGDSTGAALIFGATGGVMEAALRTANDVLSGKDMTEIEYTQVRGLQGIKEATVNLGGHELNVAVVHGTGNARALLDSIRSGEKTYHFIEIMACPGGCVSGGGQPIVSAQEKMRVDPRKLRAEAIYAGDRELPLRKSHQNPSVQKLYKEFLGEPNSEKAHKLLHTHYTARDRKSVV